MISLIFIFSIAWADPTYKIMIEGHHLSPEDLQVAANESFWLEVENKDNTSEEIESRSINIEKVIGPKKTARIKIRKLTAGTYDLFGDFHADVCKGTITAVENAPVDKVSK